MGDRLSEIKAKAARTVHVGSDVQWLISELEQAQQENTELRIDLGNARARIAELEAEIETAWQMLDIPRVKSHTISQGVAAWRADILCAEQEHFHRKGRREALDRAADYLERNGAMAFANDVRAMKEQA